ncbi:MAG: C10 family peptidase [Bacteroidetes bacterium]|nr:C10 family peptidase [Bacteroidota bacterium]MBU1719773.1 C10 family peptidase [Bacteroidota bacterium]
MMRKALTLILGIALLAGNISGKPVSEFHAAQIATNFFHSQYFNVFGHKSDAVINSTSIKQAKGVPVHFIFTFSQGGFIIVSGDDRIFPILGYSFEDPINPDQLPAGLNDWLGLADEIIQKIQESDNTEGYQEVWERIASMDADHPVRREEFPRATPLVTARWNQDDPYNAYCPPHPDGPGGHCYAGCVATAMSQVMYYFKSPEHGTGSKQYFWGEDFTVDFENTYYRWTQMTNTANASSSDAIAELMFHCGVAVNMQYSITGSGSSLIYIPDAMSAYFHYRPSSHYRERIDYYNEWDFMIHDHIDRGIPLVYGGSGTGGHAFVCDAYQDTCYYHFNWGWGGYSNGYFFTDDLTPGSNDFTQHQDAVFELAAYDAPYCRQGRVLTEQSRSFDDGSGPSFYWNDTDCDWLISPPGAEYIVLDFDAFTTSSGDVLYIYDGQDETATLVGQYSGNQTPPHFVSSTGKVFLRFVTDGSQQNFGWDARYASNIASVREQKSQPGATIFPNPAKGNVNITVNDNSFGKATIEFYHTNGQLVFAQPTDFTQANSVQIPTAKLAQGCYFVKITGQQGVINQTLVIISE